MRPRHILLLIALLAVPVGVGVLLAGSMGKQPAASGSSPTLIGLNLKGGTGQTQASACGIAHHYTQYPADQRIYFGGTVTSAPGARWKVKLKLKACIGGQFEDAGSVGTRVRSNGTYKGSFRAPVPGYYFARASLNVSQQRLTRSGKRFFQVR